MSDTSTWEAEIRKAYVFLRTNNQSIPDEVLDFMKDAALAALSTPSISQEEGTGEIDFHQELFNYFHQEHNISLLESDMHEIIRIVQSKYSAPITNNDNNGK